MALPLDMRDLMKSSTRLREERERRVRVHVIIDAEASDELVEEIRAALVPQSGNASLGVSVVVPGDVAAADGCDVVIALSGAGATLAPSLAESRKRFIPTVVVALGEESESVARRLSHPVLDIVARNEAGKAIDALGLWLSERVALKRLALAANFPFVRRAVADEAVKSTAFQNGVIGGVVFIPGADMPLMTANQAKMVMQIAAAYGQPLGAERIKELATVIGGAFVFRTVARQAVALLPGFGWALKAAVGYSGTVAMGRAAISYFESGADLSGLTARLVHARDEAVALARRPHSQRLAERSRDAGSSE